MTISHHVCRFAAVAFAVSVGTSVSHAEGIAFAYAPEQGSGYCLGEEMASTVDCARQKCTESGAALEDCLPMAWCINAGWSTSVGVMHKEGLHWSEFSCGWPSRDAAIAAANVLCDLAHRGDFIQQCFVGVLWDPEGNEIYLEDEAEE